MLIVGITGQSPDVIQEGMFKTKRDILQSRQNLHDLYTFHNCGGMREARVESTPVKRREAIPELNIHTDVNQMISELEETIVLKRPRMEPIELRKELKASSARLQKIKNGTALSQVVRQPSIIYPLQKARKVGFMEERDAIRAPRGYVVPQVPRPPEFVLPSDLCADPVSITHNEFNKFKNQIYEEDRMKLNQVIEDLNRRNKRREKNMCEEYEDMMKFGLREARRRAQRAGRLSELRTRRTERWWSEFVSEYKKDGKNPMDLVFLDLLSSVSEFNGTTIGGVYREGLVKHRSYAKKLKDMILRINELGRIVEPYKLNMIFKEIEGQVELDDYVAQRTA